MNPDSSTSPRPDNAVEQSEAHEPPAPSSTSGSAGSSPTSASPVSAPRPNWGSGATGASDADVELVSDYSWRNFFSTINFVHILQKLTKRKTHRVLLMVQYKSSVRALSLWSLGTGTGSRADPGRAHHPTGDSQAHPQGVAPDAAALCPQGDQEPGSLLRAQVAAGCVSLSAARESTGHCTDVLPCTHAQPT